MKTKLTFTTATHWVDLLKGAVMLLVLAATLTAITPAAAQDASADGPVYYVIHQNVHDETRFAEYVEAVMPAIARIGGQLVAAGDSDYTEAPIPHERIVVFYYPSRTVLEDFLISDEYAEIRRLRAGAVDWLGTIVTALPANATDMK